MNNSKTRRDFLKISATSALGITALGANGFTTFSKAGKKSFGVGLQLYSIRDAMAADTKGSLEKVSDIGYKYLELASYSNGKFYGYSPTEFKMMADDLGMEALSSHAQASATITNLDNVKKMAEAHAMLGVKYCIQPYINDRDRTIEKYKEMIEIWNKTGQIMKNAGIQFGYHNHNFEFAPTGGIVPYYDIFLKEMDPELITMEIDLYWAIKAGQDPVEMFKKYPGRFGLFHFKDGSEKTEPYFNTTQKDISSVGAGLIDFNRIYEAREIAGMKHFFVEDDNQGNGNPFGGIQTSIDNMVDKILK